MRPSERPSFPCPTLLKEELTDRILSAHARLIVGDGIVGEQVREVVPQTEFDVMSVGILQALDGADGLDAFNVGLKAFDPCFEGRQRVRLLGRGQDYSMRRSRGRRPGWVSRASAGFYHPGPD